MLVVLVIIWRWFQLRTLHPCLCWTLSLLLFTLYFLYLWNFGFLKLLRLRVYLFRWRFLLKITVIVQFLLWIVLTVLTSNINKKILELWRFSKFPSQEFSLILINLISIFSMLQKNKEILMFLFQRYNFIKILFLCYTKNNMPSYFLSYLCFKSWNICICLKNKMIFDCNHIILCPFVELHK